MGKSWRSTLIRAGALAVTAFVVFKFLLLPVRISGISMEPTYKNRSINFISTLSYRFQTPQRGDVVAIRMAGRRVMLFKRIIGLPDERLKFEKGKLIVNDEIINEPYLKTEYNWDLEEVLIGEDEFFVAGDNRGMAIDAHTHGRVSKERIIGGPLF